MTYALLNLAVLSFALGLGAFVRWRTPPAMRASWRALGVTLAVLVVLTAVFDNVIIGVGLVAYDASSVSGIRLGFAPIEDFAYSVAAVAVIPALWARAAARGETS